MKIDISNLFYTTLPRSVCLSPLHSPPSHSCTPAPCTSVSQWPAATGSQAHCHFQWFSLCVLSAKSQRKLRIVQL